jgi:hypothetical protein
MGAPPSSRPSQRLCPKTSCPCPCQSGGSTAVAEAVGGADGARRWQRARVEIKVPWVVEGGGGTPATFVEGWR